jgi:hypothetical protein
VENFEKLVDQSIAALIELVGKYATAEYRPIDFGRKAQYFTLDVISSVAYGKPFGYLASDSDVYDYIQTTEKILPAIGIMTTFPWINWVLRMDVVQKYLPSERDPVGFGKIMAVAKQIVGERFGPEKKSHADMLGSFVRHGLTQVEAESESILQM